MRNWGLMVSFLALLFLSSQLTAQVVIREKVAIDPADSLRFEDLPLSTTTSSPSPQLLTSNGRWLTANAAGITITGSADLSPSTIPRGSIVELRASVGGTSYLLKRVRHACNGTITNESFPLPQTLIENCGGSIVFSLVLFEQSLWTWYCAETFKSSPSSTATAGGGTGTISFKFSLVNVDVRPIQWPEFTATLTVSASLVGGSQASDVVVEPVQDSLVCGGGIDVRVQVKNERGAPYQLCNNAPLLAMASVKAKGEYVYLVAGSETGASVQFSLRSGEGTVRVVLDTSRGVIPNGRDIATVTVTAGGASGSASIDLICSYPPPSVRIVSPTRDTTIILTETNKPVIIFQETHSPSSGKFEPAISWSPSQTINTADYFEQIQDSLVITVKVTARNIADMVAVDSVRIVLKKKGCEDAPACLIPGPPVSPSFEVIPRPNGFNNRFLKSCQDNPNALGAFVPIEEANSLSTEPFTVQVCFDKAAGQWRFRVPQTIQVNALLDLCVNNVPRGVRLIDDVTEVDAVDRCAVALRDFNGHYTYPVRYEKYLLRSVLLMHEEMHRLDFQ